MEDLKLTIKFSNVIPFPNKEQRVQREAEDIQYTLHQMESDLDQQMDIIMQKAEEVEQLSADLLRLAEDMLRNPGKYE